VLVVDLGVVVVVVVGGLVVGVGRIVVGVVDLVVLVVVGGSVEAVVVVDRRTVVLGDAGRRVTVGERSDGDNVVGVDGMVAPAAAPRPGTSAFSWGNSQGANHRAPAVVKCTPS
jgi:hypothetical protein